MRKSHEKNRAEGVVLFAPLGPNPAPLSELVWALFRQRDQRVEKAFVVADPKANYFLCMEFLNEGGALDQLHETLGKEILPHDQVEILEAKTAKGEDLENDDDPALARAYHSLLWQGAKAAIKEAGDRPVVFGLIAGRRRTMTAAQTMIFQLLARPQDACIDVRVSDSAVEGGSGFFFPEQQSPLDPSVAGSVKAKDVDVILVDVAAPRLGSLLPKSALKTYDSALAAGQQAIDRLSPPTIELDWNALTLTVNGEKAGLSKAEVVWYGTLLEGSKKGSGWVEVAQVEPIRTLVTRHNVAQHEGAIRSKPMRYFMGETFPSYDDFDAAEDLRPTRSRVIRKMKAFTQTHCPQHAHLLVPRGKREQLEGGTVHFQRVLG